MTEIELSQAARDALINAERRLGAKVTALPNVLSELFRAHLIGASNGLTRKGVTAKFREMERRLDAAFS